MTHETLTAERIEEGRWLLAQYQQEPQPVEQAGYWPQVVTDTFSEWLLENAPALLSAAATAREQAERIAELERENARLRSLEREVQHWLDNNPQQAVRVHEGGGYENLAASFAISVVKLGAITGEQP